MFKIFNETCLEIQTIYVIITQNNIHRQCKSLTVVFCNNCIIILYRRVSKVRAVLTFEIIGLKGAYFPGGAYFRVALTFKLLFSASAKVKSMLNIIMHVIIRNKCIYIF